MAGNKELFEQAMNQGHNAAWDQIWDRAAVFYRQALDEFPDHPKALTSLALALFELQSYEEALDCYRRLSQITPEDALPQEKVAELLERLGRSDQATEAFLKSAELYLRSKDVNKGIDMWMRVVSIKPDHLMAHSRLALVYERLGRKSEAVKEYMMVAGLLQHASEVQKAMQTLIHATQVMPENAELQQAISTVKMGRLLPRPLPRMPTTPIIQTPAKRETPELPKPASVEAKLDPIAEAKQKAMAVLADMLFIQMEDEDPQAQRRGMQHIIRKAGGTGPLQMDQSRLMAYLNQAIDLLTRKQIPEALDELEKVIGGGLDIPAAYFICGTLLVEANRLESASRHLVKTNQHKDFALAANLLLGQNSFKMSKMKDASVYLLRALKEADMRMVPDEQAEMLAQAYDPFIEAQEQSEESETARRLCENLMGMMIAPDWKQRLKQARQQLTSEGGVPAPLVEVLMASESNAIVESLTRIQKLAQQGKQRAAMEEAFYALGIAPTYLPLHILMGELLLQQSEFQGAVDKFSIVARSYNTRGDTRRAISIYRRVIDLSPMDMAARNQLIALMVSGGQQEEAILEYNRLADLYYSLADLDNVSTTLSQALQLTQQPGISKASKVRIYSRIADVETQRLDWRKALRMYEQVRTLQPDDEKTRGTLIYINFRLGQDSQAVAEINNYVKLLLERNQPEKITSFLEDLAEEYPEHPGILRQLGDFYRQSGRTQDAIQKLDMAGELFLDAGQREAAIETIMAILAMNPPNASNYQQLLLQLRGG